MLGDDQPDDTQRNGTINSESRTYEATDPRYLGDQSSDLPRDCTDPGTDERKNTAGFTAKYDVDNGVAHEQEGGIASHKDVAVCTCNLARGSGDDECGGHGSGILQSDAPASVLATVFLTGEDFLLRFGPTFVVISYCRHDLENLSTVVGARWETVYGVW